MELLKGTRSFDKKGREAERFLPDFLCRDLFFSFRLDCLYGDAAPFIDVLTADLEVMARNHDYRMSNLEVQQALVHLLDHVSTHLESGMTCALYNAAVLWCDWPRCDIPRTWLKVAAFFESKCFDKST